MASAIGACLCR